jgi:NhaP-type Na+/H+ or K+/H+ antiporter
MLIFKIFAGAFGALLAVFLLMLISFAAMAIANGPQSVEANNFGEGIYLLLILVIGGPMAGFIGGALAVRLVSALKQNDE